MNSEAAALYGLCADARAVAEVIGIERTMSLVGQVIDWKTRRGCLYVPAERIERSRLAALVGVEDARRMSEALGGCILKFSSCDGAARRLRDQAVVQMLRDGLPPRWAAWSVGITHRQANNIKTLWLAD